MGSGGLHPASLAYNQRMRIVILSVLLVVALLGAHERPVRDVASVPEPVRVGLALSGGAALGFAHIGVLKVLEREGIPVIGISGNSMGALVGGMYSAGYAAADIESLAVNADWGVLFGSGIPFGARYLPERQQAQRYVVQLRHRRLFPSIPSGLVPLQNVEFLLMDMLSEIEYNTGYDFDRLPIPYRAVAVDLVSGKLEVLRDGRLEQAIRSSIAIPGVFAPERLGEMELVDGGVQQYLPVEPLDEFEPDFIIAVLTMKHNPETGISLIDITSRTMDIIGVTDLAEQKAMADVLIEPNVDPFAHSDFARAAGLIAAGEAAAEAALPEIRRKLAGRKPVAQRNEVRVAPLCMVRSVRFDGLHATRDAVLRPLMKTEPGRYLLFSRLHQDLVRLFHTGLFEDVNYRLAFVAGDTVDLVVELQERAYGFYSLGIRYDNVDNVGLGMEVGQGNLGGSGASIRAALHLGDPTEFRFGLTGTRLFMLPVGYRLDGFWGTIRRSYYEAGRLQGSYSTSYRGGVGEVGYVFGRDAYFNIGPVACQAGYRVPAQAPPALESLPEQEWIVGPRFRFAFNSFDDLFVPSNGLRFHCDVRHASTFYGGDMDMVRVELASDRVTPLGSRLLLHDGWSFGMMLGDSVWAEYFHVGGENLPGFAREEFTSPYQMAGRYGVDVRLLNLFGRDEYPLFLGAFANVVTVARLDQVLEAPDLLTVLNWSAGLGLLANTPVGPVRLTVGVADFGKPVSFAWPGPRLNLSLAMGRDFRYTR